MIILNDGDSDSLSEEDFSLDSDSLLFGEDMQTLFTMTMKIVVTLTEYLKLSRKWTVL
jgi:hypothetical protein